MPNQPQQRPKNLWKLAWIIPTVLIGGAALLVVGTILLVIGAFVVHDVKQKMGSSTPSGPPPPPAVPVTMPPGGFRPAPTTVPTQPSFDEVIRRVREQSTPTTQR